jgi:hypothetical protein
MSMNPETPLKRFYRDGRKVMDREPGSRSPTYCTARSNHAADVIQLALNGWHGMGPTKTPQMTGKDYAQVRRLKAMAKKASSNES